MNVTANRRMLGFATGVTFVTAILAGLVASLSLYSFLPFISHTYLAHEVSGPAPVVAHGLLLLFQATIAAGYVLLPIGVASYYATTGARHPVYYGVLAVVAILGLPGLRFVVDALFRGGTTALLAVVLAGVFVGGLSGAFWVARARGPDDPDEGIPVGIFVNLGFLVVVLTGLILGGAVAGDAMAGVVETDSPSWPTVSLEASYTPVDGGQNTGVLTLRHTGGEAVPPARLVINGEGFADVDGVDQTAPGRWRGETSYGDDGAMVGPGDTVAVGVKADCRSLIVYQYGEQSTVFQQYNCEALRN